MGTERRLELVTEGFFASLEMVRRGRRLEELLLEKLLEVKMSLQVVERLTLQETEVLRLLELMLLSAGQVLEMLMRIVS